MLGTGNATVTNNVATPIPIRFATEDEERQDDLDADPPAALAFRSPCPAARSRSPVSSDSRPLCRVTASSTRPKPLRRRSCWQSWWRQPNLPRALALRLIGASRHRPVHRRLRRAPHRPSALGTPAAAVQGRRVGQRACRRPRLQAAELDEPALLDDRGARRRRAGVGGGEQGRRAAAHHRRGDRARLEPRARASIPGWSRTVSRRTCRRCWPSTSSCSVPGTRWCAAST